MKKSVEQVVTDFINMHAYNDQSDWGIFADEYGGVYFQLETGEFGEVRRYNENREECQDGKMMEIEISSCISKSGHFEIFEWESPGE